MSKRKRLKQRLLGAYRLKRSRQIWARGGVVDSDPSIVAIIELVRHLGHSLVGAVAGFEVQVRRPVVGDIFLEVASCARAELRDVGGGHRGGECVSPHNLVHVRGRGHAGIDKSEFISSLPL